LITLLRAAEAADEAELLPQKPAVAAAAAEQQPTEQMEQRLAAQAALLVLPAWQCLAEPEPPVELMQLKAVPLNSAEPAVVGTLTFLPTEMVVAAFTVVELVELAKVQLRFPQLSQPAPAELPVNTPVATVELQVAVPAVQASQDLRVPA